jgi:FtsP/CotA-like multicopper oxidase with cupredoxin domain
MSRNQRIGLLLAALAVAVVAIAVAVASGGEDDEGDQATRTTQATTETQPETETGTETTEQPHETVPPEPADVTRIRIEAGQVVGGPADIKVTKGDTVRIVVSADAPDDIHLHGYDIEKPAEPGQPARFKFKANIEGIFELESHVAEDAGRNPLVGKLTVEPS